MVRVYSSDTDRTISSAAANLAGMFPPTEDQIWNENLLWQPIPIHVLSKEIDTLLLHNIPCPLYDQLWKEYFTSNEILKLRRKFRVTYKKVSKIVGKPVFNVANGKKLWDTLYVEKLNNKT